MTLRQIVQQLEDPPASRTVGDDLAHLKSLHLVDSSSIGKSAKWFLVKKNWSVNGAVMGQQWGGK